jgi:2,4-didehydro-3-deoxy-L-rhamnonate hydrolase
LPLHDPRSTAAAASFRASSIPSRTNCALVTLDETGDLGNLGLRTRINGETLQQGSTSNLIFGPAELVAWLSRTMTLLPGDIIATGTPAGVGAAQGRFLRAGDTVEVEVDGLGTLTSPIRGESA